MDLSYLAEHLCRKQLGLSNPQIAESLAPAARSAASCSRNMIGEALSSALLASSRIDYPVSTSMTMDYHSYLKHQCLIAEQYRRDLATQEYLKSRARLLGNVNAVNRDQMAAANAFANTRLHPGIHGIAQVLSDKRTQEPLKKIAKRAANMPTFTSRDGAAKSFPLPPSKGECGRVIRISSLSSFHSLWSRLHEGSGCRYQSQMKETLMKELFARKIVESNGNRMQAMLQQIEARKEVPQGVGNFSESATDSGGQDCTPRHGKRKRSADVRESKASAISSAKISPSRKE